MIIILLFVNSFNHQNKIIFKQLRIETHKCNAGITRNKLRPDQLCLSSTKFEKRAVNPIWLITGISIIDTLSVKNRHPSQ